MELHRILLPDAPPRKRRSQKQSPEREECVMMPSTSAEEGRRPKSPRPSTSQEVESFEDQPLIVVPSDPAPVVLEIEYIGHTGTPDLDTVPNSPSSLDPMVFRLPTENWLVVCPPAMECEVEVEGGSPVDLRQRRSAIDSTDPESTVTEWLIDNVSDSDGDLDLDHCNDAYFLNPTFPLELAPSLYVNDLTEHQELIMSVEDRHNDEALRRLLPADHYVFDWNKDKSTFKGKRETFTGTPGPTFTITDDTTPTDIFERMIDVQFVDMLVAETNRYVTQKISTAINMPKNSRLRRWTPTDRPEMIAYLSLTLIMGLYPLPIEESYFSFNGFGTMPYISKIMSYNRYLLLKTMLHFVDNDTLTDSRSKTKLSKLQPVIDHFNNKFSSMYRPKQEIAIDESLLKWHGRLSFSQKINSKAAQVGVKTYELCESSSGYLWRFMVYTGKDKPDDGPDQTTEDKPDQTPQTTDDGHIERPTNATAKIVIDLVEPLLRQGYTLIMDNFYNCPLLARYLKLQKTDCYGTQRLHREFIPTNMKTLTKTDLRHGEIVASFCSDLTLLVWRDSNLVSMISTYHQLQIGTNEKNNKTTFKPSVVLDYNKHMGGIDRKDQYLAAHQVERTKSRVWYKKVFRRLFSCAVFNCFVLFNTKHKLSHRQFRITLAESLLKTYKNIDLTTEPRLISRTSRRPSFTVTQQTCTPKKADRPVVQGEHFPAHSPAKRGRCWWCFHKRGFTSRSVWMCQECKVNLCIVECFRSYHKPDPDKTSRSKTT